MVAAVVIQSLCVQDFLKFLEGVLMKNKDAASSRDIQLICAEFSSIQVNDSSRLMLYVVPTGRVVVPTGRYVVPAGKVIIIVSPGRLSLVPTGRVLSPEKLYAKFSKCDFWIHIVQFLGHLIDSKGLHVDSAKIEAGEDQETAFQLLKQKLCEAPILALPEGNDDFVVYCDASHQGLGAVLMQREKHILDQKELNMRQRRRLELLADYDCEIRYHPGKANVIADALSWKEQIKPL
ncbi:putative reverse transcriptase domain-containing protein [Tanacetum coccineum]|uniref:Reverse transcriptase domain-containing protein n=1 Tax=Tanacetum coccineum TaxID=301880 RepID=A0ABQ5J4A4_9ASTR